MMIQLVIDPNDPATMAAIKHLFVAGLLVGLLPVAVVCLFFLLAWLDGRGKWSK